MLPKKFLFVTLEALITDIAWLVAQEGHEVKFYAQDPGEKEVGEGFVPMVERWEDHVDWADVIVFDDVLGQGAKAQQLRAAGKKVIGGTPYTDRLEDDRAFGQEEMKKRGIAILPYHDFTSFDAAIEYVKANPARYVIKPSGQAGNIKGLLFIGEEEDGRDVIEVLDDYREAWAQKIPVFQLQKRVTGVEVAVGAFFNGRQFVYPINVNFEHKKLFPGNLGPSTGEMGCYDDQTEVLTNHGWKLFRNLRTGDGICTLNPKNDRIEYHQPTELQTFAHHRQLVYVKNQTLDVAVTEDHNMYVCSQFNARRHKNTFHFIKARNLQNQNTIKRTGTWVGKNKKFFVLPSISKGRYQKQTGSLKIPMSDWLAFFGIWLADGYVGGKYAVGVAQKVPVKTKKIARLLKILPHEFRLIQNGFVTYDKQLHDCLSGFGRATQKYVPDFIKGLATRQIEIFLDWFCLGDGTLMKSGHRIFYTASKVLADDLQELLLKVGRIGIVKVRQPRRGETIINGRVIKSSNVQYEVHERVKKLRSWLDRRDIKVRPYEGKVYCATVKNHIMYVRRNGKPLWCGNTTCFWSTPNKLFNATLKKFESTLAQEGYVGYTDINCIVNSNGIYPLEWTARFGYPMISIQQEGLITPIGELLEGLAQGTLEKFKTKSGFQIGVRIVVPPFPFTDPETFKVKSKDSIIFFKKPTDGVHIEDVKKFNNEWLVTGSSGVVLIVCGTGPTMKQAQAQVYSRIKNIIIPHMYYRTDIGDRWYEDSDRLHTWGYLREA